MQLTAFEEYMFADTTSAYPMSCFTDLRFTGLFVRERFEQAVQSVLALHPLLTSVIEQRGRKFYWRQTQNAVLMKFSVNTLDAATTQVLLEVHHSVCDAGGAFRFICDVLLEYAGVQNPEPVQPELLPQRCRRKNTKFSYLAALPRAWSFLLNRVESFPLKNRQTNGNKLNVVSHTFNPQKTFNLQQRCRDSGLTLNDAVLASVFLAVADQRTAAEPQGYIRIAVPTNLRTAADRLMPAANAASMVFIDRKPKNITDTEKFRQGIHREMQHIKRYNLGWTFIDGLRFYRRFFGSFTKMTQGNRCWTTATVSNLGVLLTDLPLPKCGGKIQITDELVLSEIHSVPPIRHLTPLGICLFSYASELTIDVHYDPKIFTQTEAGGFLQTILQHLGSDLPSLTAEKKSVQSVHLP